MRWCDKLYFLTDCFPSYVVPDASAFAPFLSAQLKQTASHHLDRGSVLTMVINSLEECIGAYVPQADPPRVDSI